VIDQVNSLSQSSLYSAPRGWLISTLERWFVFMLCRSLLYQIRVLYLLLAFGGIFRMSWVVRLTLAQLSTCRLMICQSRISMSFKTCCELLSWSLEGQWGQFMPLVEFAYNNYHSGIQMALFEALYGMHSRSPFGWFETI